MVDVPKNQTKPFFFISFLSKKITVIMPLQTFQIIGKFRTQQIFNEFNQKILKSLCC